MFAQVDCQKYREERARSIDQRTQTQDVDRSGKLGVVSKHVAVFLGSRRWCSRTQEGLQRFIIALLSFHRLSIGSDSSIIGCRSIDLHTKNFKPSPMPRAVVLTVDGLGAKHLGPYGNTWIETPTFNHLATESLLIEGLYAPHADPWTSMRELCNGSAGRDSDLLDWLDSHRIHTTLLTDSAELLDQPWVAHFAEQTEIDAPTGVRLADEWHETHSAKFFAQCITAIEAMADNSLLWLHSAGFGNPWDAPYDHRQRFADDDDPEPSGSAQVPSLQLDQDYDPDTLHEIQCAFAGQIVLLDQCLGVLYSILRQQDVLFVMTSPRGFPLGEHLTVGWKNPSLYHELLHVSGFIRFPDGRHALTRQAGLSEFTDVATALRNWFGESTSERPPRQWSASRNANEILVRTAVWQMRCLLSPAGHPEHRSAELYLKPDDQNEANDVGDRCRDVIEAACYLAEQIVAGSNTNEIELDPILSTAPD